MKMTGLIICAVCVIIFIPASIGAVDEQQPDFKDVTLWDYNVEKRTNYDDFWTASNPSKYVIPDNPVIRYYENHTDEIQIDYVPDKTDLWQNPDYTLEIMQGDCEDASLVMVSIQRARGNKAVVVGGYLILDNGTVIRDIWYEYVDNNGRHTRFVTPVVAVQQFSIRPLFMFNDKISIKDYDANWMEK